MAKRTRQNKPPPPEHRCSECEHCEPYTAHLNWKGEPILRGCPFEKYKDFMDSPACIDYFKLKL